MTAAQVANIRLRHLRLPLTAIRPLDLAIWMRKALWRSTNDSDRAMYHLMVTACERRLTTSEALVYWYWVQATRNELEAGR